MTLTRSTSAPSPTYATVTGDAGVLTVWMGTDAAIAAVFIGLLAIL